MAVYAILSVGVASLKPEKKNSSDAILSVGVRLRAGQEQLKWIFCCQSPTVNQNAPSSENPKRETKMELKQQELNGKNGSL